MHSPHKSGPLTPARRHAAQGGKRKAARASTASRLLAPASRRRIAVAAAATAAVAFVGGGVVSASAAPETDNTAAGAGGLGRADVSGVVADRGETDVSRSSERPAVADEKAAPARTAPDKAATEKAAPTKARSIAAAKKQQVAKAAGASKIITKTARMQDRDPRQIAKALLSDFGFGADQFSCLNDLWVGESNWRWNADNPTSSAYGIPQALPGSKMASAGADWETNPATQITWGLGYIKDVYGTPCAAQSFKQGAGWY
ncbi:MULTISPECIES: lytic transglycosylase domain-containing protein [Mumia]|uniref:Lytic transglycosylase domain-containing protein n=1 Tax=Mumia xiangluensis TaxID=1678900 RepID=A0ABW1QGC5_9ACTN|nr:MULTISPECIES: lytic transglycosylase domain-containing protein [Mumia]